MVSTPEGFTDKIPISTMTSTPIKKKSAQKSLCLFTKFFEVKETDYCRVGSAKSKRKAIKYGNKPRALKKKRKVNSKIYEQINKSLY